MFVLPDKGPEKGVDPLGATGDEFCKGLHYAVSNEGAADFIISGPVRSGLERWYTKASSH